jgi:hypothetical protein
MIKTTLDEIQSSMKFRIININSRMKQSSLENFQPMKNEKVQVEENALNKETFSKFHRS